MEDVPDSKDYSFPGEELKVLEWWDEVREMRRERESECSRRASAGVGTAVQAPALTPSFRRYRGMMPCYSLSSGWAEIGKPAGSSSFN